MPFFYRFTFLLLLTPSIALANGAQSCGPNFSLSLPSDTTVTQEFIGPYPAGFGFIAYSFLSDAISDCNAAAPMGNYVQSDLSFVGCGYTRLPCEDTLYTGGTVIDAAANSSYKMYGLAQAPACDTSKFEPDTEYFFAVKRIQGQQQWARDPFCHENCKFTDALLDKTTTLEDGTVLDHAGYFLVDDQDPTCVAEDYSTFNVASDFTNYLDSEGCYVNTDSDRYCKDTTDTCPEFIEINQTRFCRIANNDNDNDNDNNGNNNNGGNTDGGNTGGTDGGNNGNNSGNNGGNNGGTDSGSGDNSGGSTGGGSSGGGSTGGGDTSGGSDSGSGSGSGSGDVGGGNSGGGSGTDDNSGSGTGDNSGSGTGDNSGSGSSSGDGSSNGSGDGQNNDGTDDSGNDDEGGGSTSGGSCVLGNISQPNCSPYLDAVQCAIYIQTWVNRCQNKLEQDRAEEFRQQFTSTDTFNNGQSLLDSSQSGNQIISDSIDLSNEFNGFDSSGFLNSDGASPIYTFSYAGQTFEISANPLLELARFVGWIVLALAIFFASKIVMSVFD